MKNILRVISMLVCFAGSNRRVEINPKKCTINRATKMFTYKGLYTADNGVTYLVTAESLPNTNGSKAKVKVTNRSGKQLIAERPCVDVRFYRYLFD